MNLSRLFRRQKTIPLPEGIQQTDTGSRDSRLDEIACAIPYRDTWPQTAGQHERTWKKIQHAIAKDELAKREAILEAIYAADTAPHGIYPVRFIDELRRRGWLIVRRESREWADDDHCDGTD